MRHRRIVLIAGVAGPAALLSLRVGIELGFAPAGSLRSFAMLPLEYVYLVWFFALWALSFGAQKLSEPARLRLTAYEWWLGVIGLAGTLWLIQNLGAYRFIISESWAYPFASACAVIVFLSASTVERDQGIGLARNVLLDALRVFRRPTTWLCVLAAITVLSVAPRSFETPTEGRAFRRWYARQAPQAVPASWAIRPVTLVELTDYQCPACRDAWSRYHEVIRSSEEKYGRSFGFHRVDFPLENECNAFGRSGAPGDLHAAACEAAAAVRLARAAGPAQEREVVEWLWARQSQLTPEVVFDGIHKEFGINVRSSYRDLLPAISRDASEARRLRVTGTPAYFLNGRRLPMLSASTLQAAIDIEIELTLRNPQQAKR